MTRNDWLQFLSYYARVGVLFLLSGLVVMVVTLSKGAARDGGRIAIELPQMMQGCEVRF